MPLMTSMGPVTDATAALIDALVACCGAESISTDPARCALMGQDVHATGPAPIAVIRPPNRDSAAQAVGIATAYGLAIYPRGGGMSYTDAYRVTRLGIVIDTGALDAVLAIDARALTVTVEAGCTWAKLDNALAPYGVRAAFWGPFSGYDATIGGSLSQGTATFGSSSAGTSGDNVLSIEVALADGRRVQTGMDAKAGTLPFFAQYGPNLTGLFANDAGALGLKLSATLPLVPRATHIEGASFVFSQFADLAAALETVSRAGLASEALAMDPVVTAQFSGTPDLRTDLAMLRRITQGPGGLRRAFAALTGGRRVLSRPGYHCHIICEGRDARDLALKLADVRQHCAAGTEIANSVPSAIRALPFSPLPVTDPRGRRVLPIHGIIPYARATSLDVAIMAIIAAHAESTQQAGLIVATSFFAIGRNALLYEPVFYWEDELSAYQLSKSTADVRYPANPAARALVETMRAEMVDVMQAHGAAHLQIGKAYPYAAARDMSLLRAVKGVVDSQGLMNPGALGL
jgi:FAD/FMN-containing dehydrogenase